MPAIRYARTRDGVSIAYQAFGAGTTPLVIIHPWISHVEIYWEWAGFRRFAAALAETCRVLHFDKRGVGLSDRLVTIPTFEARLDDITGLLDAERWERAALYGYGDGAALAAAFAATYPGRITALVLQGDSPFRSLPAIPTRVELLRSNLRLMPQSNEEFGAIRHRGPHLRH